MHAHILRQTESHVTARNLHTAKYSYSTTRELPSRSLLLLRATYRLLSSSSLSKTPLALCFLGQLLFLPLAVEGGPLSISTSSPLLTD